MTEIYLCDSLIDMAADAKAQRDAGSIHTDRIGKVFIVVAQDVRRCQICEQLFTRRAASEHAKAACRPIS